MLHRAPDSLKLRITFTLKVNKTSFCLGLVYILARLQALKVWPQKSHYQLTITSEYSPSTAKTQHNPPPNFVVGLSCFTLGLPLLNPVNPATVSTRL